jgi:hypothetical protein
VVSLKPDPGPSPIRLIYIAGSSRSGSTILDALLDSHADVMAIGEVYHLAREFPGRPHVCACSRPIGSCAFWGPVLQSWREALAPSDLSVYRVAQEGYERFRSVPRLLLQVVRRSSGFRIYAAWTAQLFAILRARAGVQVLADSSKHPLRLASLLLMDGFETSVILLVRDPRAVAWSRLKYLPPVFRNRWLRGPFGETVHSAGDWLLYTLLSEVVVRLASRARSVRVRYEDLSARPAEELSRLGHELGLDLSDVGRRAAQGEPFGFGHIVSGNRARHGGPRPLRQDAEWQTASPRWMRRLVWLLTGVVARRYGYQW